MTQDSEPPRQVTVRRILIATGALPAGGHRSPGDAEVLARSILGDARSGGNFSDLVARHSDIPSPSGHPNPGRLVILDHGVHGQTFQTFLFSLNERAARREEELGELVAAGRLAPKAAEAEMNRFLDACQDEAENAGLPHPRGTLPLGLGDLAFSLAEGEVGLVAWDSEDSPEGWLVVLREG